MLVQKRWNFGLGTILSLIIVYFIFLYSREHSWGLLAFVSKWYLIIIGGFFALSLGIILIVILASLLMILIAAIKMRKFSHKRKNQKDSSYVDIEYKVKE